MQYYRLLRDVTTNGLVCTAGELHGFDPNLITSGVPIPDWNRHVTLIYDDLGGVEDYLANTHNWPVVSSKFREAVDPIIGAEVQFLPIEVRHRHSSSLVAGFFVMNVLHVTSALDMEMSSYRTTEIQGRQVIAGVDRYVLRRDLLSGKNIVRLAEFRVSLVVSDRVRNAIQAAGLSGCVCRTVQFS